MSETKVVTVPGVGFLGLLTILFIGLKLTGFINWSWLWVLSPVWIPPAIGLGFIALVLLGMAVCFGIGLLLAAIK